MKLKHSRYLMGSTQTKGISAVIGLLAVLTSCSEFNTPETNTNPDGPTYSVSIPAVMNADVQTRAISADADTVWQTIDPTVMTDVTRAVSLNAAGSLDATFKTTDYVNVYHKGLQKFAKKQEVLHPDKDGTTANLTGTLAFNNQQVTQGDELRLIYCSTYNCHEHGVTNPSFLPYQDQAGTLAGLSDHDYAIADVTIQSVEGDKTNGYTLTTSKAEFENMQSMFKLTFTGLAGNDGIASVNIHSAGRHLFEILDPREKDYNSNHADITINLNDAARAANGPGVVYAALRFDALSSATATDNITFTVTSTSGATYIATKTSPAGGFQCGKFYTTTIALPSPLDDMIPGNFSVGSSSKVRFSKGNLQQTDGTWRFANSQLSYLGTTQSYDQRDMFSYNDLFPGGTFSAPMGNWRCLTKDEWDYLLNSRSVTNTLSSGARYTEATVGSVKGLIVFPDEYFHPSGTGFTPGTYNAASNYTATVDLDGWAKMEAAGALFLPAAGYYSMGSTWKEVGESGCYMTSQATGSRYYDPYFTPTQVTTNETSDKKTWSSVRLAINDTNYPFVIPSITFNLTANYPDLGDGDEKQEWAAGDVIFVFLNHVMAPTHLKMTYDGSKWNTAEYSGESQLASDAICLPDGVSGTMRAVYLPFAENASVSTDDDGTSFVFSKLNYSYYLTATLPFTVTNGKISGAFDMAMADGYVKFFVEDAEAASGYCGLGTDAVTPMVLYSIAADGSVNEITDKTYTDDLVGFAYNNGKGKKGYLFSGKLNADYNYAGHYFAKKKYPSQDRSDYFVTTTNLPLASGSAITLPADGNDRWIPVGPGKTVYVGYCGTWATCNLGANLPEEMGSGSVISEEIEKAATFPSLEQCSNLKADEEPITLTIHGVLGVVFDDGPGFIFMPFYGSTDSEFYWTSTTTTNGKGKTYYYALRIYSNQSRAIKFSPISPDYYHWVRMAY